jgi:hypothetical protein
MLVVTLKLVMALMAFTPSGSITLVLFVRQTDTAGRAFNCLGQDGAMRGKLGYEVIQMKLVDCTQLKVRAEEEDN